jgi:6-phosphogluconate dehydrogenase
MQIGMIGLGRMGGNMVRRLLKGGHECVVYSRSADGFKDLPGAVGTIDLKDFVARLKAPRAVWLMVPAAAVDTVLGGIVPLLSPGDTVIDGGNSYYRDDIRRAAELGKSSIHYVDCGTSGGIFGLERGYCLMIGGETDAVQRLNPIFATLAPGAGSISRTPGRNRPGSTADQGFLHCGPHGAGHFVKMVHNGIEYGLMAAYAEGLNILKNADAGTRSGDKDAETAPMTNPEFYRYSLDLPEIAELWRRGSVVASWLLDLTATALASDPSLAGFSGRVSDSGEGRWTALAAIEEGVPAPVISTALFDRFASQGSVGFANKVLSAMRKQFGGHDEKKGGN